MVVELSVEDIISILCGLKECFEIYYGVWIYDNVLVVVVKLFDCYIMDCYLLDKVLDLVDEVFVEIWVEMNFNLMELD